LELKRIQEKPSSVGGGGAGIFGEERENITKFTGCTATVVLVSPSQIFCANAGDSRSVLRRHNPDQTVALSQDHKPENPDERKRIEAAGGFVDENRVNGSLNLSRSFGDFEYKSRSDKSLYEQMVTCDPEITKLDRTANDDFLVLACDGIWDCLTNEGCCDMLKEHRKSKEDQPLSKSIEEMFEKIIAKDILQSSGVGTDNMTCLFIEFLNTGKE
jgi:protein phosphatase 2C family protein 2/3